MSERFKRFVEIEITHIAKRFRYESSVQKMHTRMFGSANVFIDGKHFVYNLGVKRHFGVFAVRIPEVIPARTYKGVERVGVSLRFSAAFRAGRIHKRFAFGER